MTSISRTSSAPAFSTSIFRKHAPAFRSPARRSARSTSRTDTKPTPSTRGASRLRPDAHYLRGPVRGLDTSRHCSLRGDCRGRARAVRRVDVGLVDLRHGRHVGELGIDQNMELAARRSRRRKTRTASPTRRRVARGAGTRARDVAVLDTRTKPGRVGDWYHNSGTWVGAADSFLRIDPEGHVGYFEWKEGRALEHEAPCVFPDAEPERNPLKKAAASVRLLFPRPTRPERSRLILMAQGALALALGVWGFFTRSPRHEPPPSPR